MNGDGAKRSQVGLARLVYVGGGQAGEAPQPFLWVPHFAQGVGGPLEAGPAHGQVVEETSRDLLGEATASQAALPQTQPRTNACRGPAGLFGSGKGQFRAGLPLLQRAPSLQMGTQEGPLGLISTPYVGAAPALSHGGREAERSPLLSGDGFCGFPLWS